MEGAQREGGTQGKTNRKKERKELQSRDKDDRENEVMANRSRGGHRALEKERE